MMRRWDAASNMSNQSEQREFSVDNFGFGINPAFHSKAVQVVRAAKQGKGPGKQWLGIMRNAGVKAEDADSTYPVSPDEASDIVNIDT